MYTGVETSWNETTVFCSRSVGEGAEQKRAPAHHASSNVLRSVWCTGQTQCIKQTQTAQKSLLQRTYDDGMGFGCSQSMLLLPPTSILFETALYKRIRRSILCCFER